MADDAGISTSIFMLLSPSRLLGSLGAGGVCALLLVALAAFLKHAVKRPPFSPSAPKLYTADDWPILGAWKLFRKPIDFFADAAAASETGNFSFYFGKIRMIGVSGDQARKGLFKSKEYDVPEAPKPLTLGKIEPVHPSRIKVFIQTIAPKEIPAVRTESDPTMKGDPDTADWFKRTLIGRLKGPVFSGIVPAVFKDAHDTVRTFSDKVVDPFDDIYRMVYRMTMHTLGPAEVAEDDALLRKSLALIQETEHCTSPSRLVFPWLPTPSYFRKMAAHARLYAVFRRVKEDRVKRGRRVEDSWQVLIDAGESTLKIIWFTIGSVFAAQVNSGINAAWIPAYLAAHPEWYARVQSEVDAAVAKHRTSEFQSAADVLGTLEVEHWESEFPLVDLCLRETIRLHLPGVLFRRNTSGRDVPIAGSSTGEVASHGDFVGYCVDDLHMNPAHYPEPFRWNPGRYEAETPPPYMGWGLGRHPCPGMRLAKLEVVIITALIVAMFEYEVVDAAGVKTMELPMPIRNRLMTDKPEVPVRVRFRPRGV